MASLFGGDAVHERPASRPHSPSSEAEQAPYAVRDVSLNSTQGAFKLWTRPPSQTYSLEDDGIADDEQEVDAESGSENEYDSGDDERSRSNRLSGKVPTWRGHTVKERRIAKSLEQRDSADLAAHLYNTHALKRRVRLPPDQLNNVKSWQSKDLWLKRGDDQDYTDAAGESQRALVPLKSWTAWPLRTNLDHITYGNEISTITGNGWSVGSLDEPDVVEELREELLATMLRLAKEQWNWKTLQEDQEGPQYELSPSEPRSRSRPQSKSHARSVSTSVKSERATSRAFDPSQSEAGRPDSEAAYDSEKQGVGRRRRDFLSSKIQVRGRSPPASIEATILTDDDRARRILRPSIDSTLVHLDELAVALRQMRLNHFRSTYSDTSDSEAFVEVSSPLSRPTSQTRSNSATNRNALDSDSASDFGAEHPELSEVRKATGEAVPGRSRSASRCSRSHGESKSSAQFGLLDWSEILSIASMTGWDQKVVGRTAERCAALFDEGISFRTFAEYSAMKAAPKPLHYTSATIPHVADPEGNTASTRLRPLFEKGTIRCPHAGCWGHEKEFEVSSRVIEHVRRVHGYDPRTNDSDNEERKVGGVHIDGFLQPINAKPGWLGSGRSKAVDERRKIKGRMRKRESVQPASGLDSSPE